MPKPDFIFRYRVPNWSEYNRALVRRGQLTLWFDETAIASWRQAGHTGARGRPCVYADTAIGYALVLKSVFHLSLRATQGFLQSITTMLHVGVDETSKDIVAVDITTSRVHDSRQLILCSSSCQLQLRCRETGLLHLNRVATRHRGINRTGQ